MTSGRAGVVVPVGYAPLLPGDSASGRVGIDINLAEMPKPLLNGVFANVQAWFVPKTAYPQFAGRDELLHAFTGQTIKALGLADRAPPPYFHVMTGAPVTVFANSDFAKTLGIHIPAGASINCDLIDAFNLVYNFRLAAHTSRIPRRKYAVEDITAATTLPPAFWPSSRFAHVVPDYERALVVGSLDLDVIAGRFPISGIAFSSAATRANATGTDSAGTAVTYPLSFNSTDISPIFKAGSPASRPDIWAEMAGQSVNISLADIDKARTTQAFAKLRAAYAGNDTTGFENDDTIIAHLMRGIAVPPDEFKRPWLLDSKRLAVGFAERPATDGANLDKSVTTGRASASLSINVPSQDVGGVIIFTVEVLPERIDERMSDEWLLATSVADLPNALRDVQRIEPVDLVTNRRIDAKHATPNGLYGYEAMNMKWRRDFTHLGGDFYQATPGAGWTENRSNIWQTEIVNPTFSATHYLAPQPFPHDPFSNQNGSAFEVVCRHSISIVGLTQIGDPIPENSDDYNITLAGG